MLAWGPRTEDSDRHEDQLAGVEYIRALNKLLPVVIDAESTTIRGTSVSRDGFSEALGRVAAVDQKHGGALGTTSRWSDLRARIEALAGQSTADPDGAFRVYGEVTDLILALYGRVSAASGLGSDSDGVIANLQDAAIEEIPEAMVWAGRYQDQAVIASKLTTPGGQTAQSVIQAQQEQLNSALTALAVTRQTASESGADVASDMDAAVQASESGTFDGNLLRNLDAFQRSIEALAPSGRISLTARPNPDEVARLRAAEQAAAVALSPALLDELESAIEDSKSSADTGRMLAIALLAVTVLLLIGGFVAGGAGRSRRRAARPNPNLNPNPEPFQGQGGPYQYRPESEAFMQNVNPGHDARRERVGVPR